MTKTKPHAPTALLFALTLALPLAFAACTSPMGDDETGAAGQSGAAGAAGTTGAAGQPGAAGQTGAAGQPGAAGQTGAAGQPGVAGQTGAAGQLGVAGAAGTASGGASGTGVAGAPGRGGASGTGGGAAGRGGSPGGAGRGGGTANGGAGGGAPVGGSAGTGPHVCGTGAEGANVSLTCPAGQVIASVVFASYGTPAGSCGAFTAGACNATDSVEVVRATCVGRQTCTVPASNDVFGNPCNKTVKSIAVEVACAPGGGAGGAGGGTGNGCPFSGHVTYTLVKSANPTADEQAAYARIATAMDAAVANYNCYANITKADTITLNAGVETADGSTNGSIRFGTNPAYQTMSRAMHEIAHTVGIGSSPFAALCTSAKVFTGANATTQLRQITGVATDEVHGDGTHFWPYGLNYETEYHDISDAINHCKMVTAIRKDMGMN